MKLEAVGSDSRLEEELDREETQSLAPVPVSRQVQALSHQVYCLGNHAEGADTRWVSQTSH